MTQKLQYWIILLALVFTGVNSGLAQKKYLLKKADKEYNEFGYIDARAIYLSVLDGGYESARIYEKLGDTYYWNANYTSAAKYYDQLMTKFPDQSEDIEVYYRASQSFRSQGRFDDAERLLATYMEKGGSFISADRVMTDDELLSEIGIHLRRYDITKSGISTNASDFGPMYYGDKVLFSSVAKENTGIHKWNKQPFLDIYQADIDEDGQLSNAVALGEEINSPFHESSAVVSKDGKTLYFTRNNYVEGKKMYDDGKNVRLKIFSATMGDDGSWKNTTPLPFNNNNYSTAHPAISPDGTKLFFSSDMPGTLGSSDLWYVDIKGENTYGEPVNLGSKINTAKRENFPFLSEKGNFYFSSDGHVGIGGLDIFLVANYQTGKEGYQIDTFNDAINSSDDDFGFIIDEAKGTGYYSSNKGAKNGSLDDDIYFLKERCEVIMSGVVTNARSGELLPGAFVVFLDENNKSIKGLTVGDDAAYSFIGDCSKKYSIQASLPGFIPNEIKIETPAESVRMNVPIALTPIGCAPDDLGCLLSLEPIYFDLDKHFIRPDAKIELAKILEAMKKYPQLNIHIESHTDSRASHDYNIALSKRRAKATREWLIENGIAPGRLTSDGYGETRLTNNCADGVDCTEQMHQLNRRSMFIIQPIKKSD